MRFQVPQFLEIEDKIFGPFTFKEFIYLVGGGGICYILYKSLGLMLGAIPILFVGGISALLTFYKPNGKPFINMVQASLKYALRDKLYIWKRRMEGEEERTKKTVSVENKNARENIKITPGKLRDLAWSLDILDLKKKEE